MFDHARYASKGIINTVDIPTQNLLWLMTESMEVSDKDYLQTFILSAGEGRQQIIHTQEQPDYRKEFSFPCDKPIAAQIYIIDNGNYSTMLLAGEY